MELGTDPNLYHVPATKPGRLDDEQPISLSLLWLGSYHCDLSLFIRDFRGATMLSVLKRSGLAGEKPSENNFLRCNAWLAPISIMIELIFHLARPWTFWFLMFNYSHTSIILSGGDVVQAYMVFLSLWLAIIFRTVVLNYVKRLYRNWKISAKCIDILNKVYEFNQRIVTLLCSIALGRLYRLYYPP